MLNALTTLVVLYALLLTVVAIFQRRLIYFPERFTAKLGAVLAAQEGFQPWKDESGRIIGWKLPAAGATGGASIGTVLIVHGNAGSALNRAYLAKPLHETAALDVYILEYPGYGSREGSPSQQSLLAAAEEAFAALPKTRPTYLVSESLGAGVAAHLAKTHAVQVAGLAMLAPYNDLVSVGQRQMRFLPVSWLLRDRFAPAVWLKDYRGPAVFVVAGADEIIPPEFGKRLHDGYAGPKELQVIQGAGHNDVAGQSAEWWKKVLAFWQSHAG